MSFFQLPLWLKGLNSSTGTDKLLAVKDNGEVTKSNKTLDEIGLTPSLQDVLAEDNTAITEGNWQSGSNRTRVTSNNGIYVQNTNIQARLKTNGIIFRDISTNNSIEINFAGSTGIHSQVLQDKAGTIALISDIPVIRTMNSADTQTSALLNLSFPLLEHPVGAIVVNLNSSQKYIYTRVSNTNWRRGALMTDI